MLKNAPIVPYIPVAQLARARRFYEEKDLRVWQGLVGLHVLKTVNSIATGGGAKTAWFKDSEGNILAVSQRVSG